VRYVLEAVSNTAPPPPEQGGCCRYSNALQMHVLLPGLTCITCSIIQLGSSVGCRWGSLL
jgi:hypothetical protein